MFFFVNIQIETTSLNKNKIRNIDNHQKRNAILLKMKTLSLYNFTIFHNEMYPFSIYHDL